MYRRAALLCAFALLLVAPEICSAKGAISPAGVDAADGLARRLAAGRVDSPRKTAATDVEDAGIAVASQQPAAAAAAEASSQRPAATPSVQQPATPIQVQAVQPSAAHEPAVMHEEMDALLQARFMPEDWKERLHTQHAPSDAGDGPADGDRRSARIQARADNEREEEEEGADARLGRSYSRPGDEEEQQGPAVAVAREDSSAPSREREEPVAAAAAAAAASAAEEGAEQRGADDKQASAAAQAANPIASTIQEAVQARQAAEDAREEQQEREQEAAASAPKEEEEQQQQQQQQQPELAAEDDSARGVRPNHTHPDPKPNPAWPGITAYIEQSIDIDTSKKGHGKAGASAHKHRRHDGDGKDGDKEQYEDGGKGAEHDSKQERLSKYYEEPAEEEEDGEGIAVSGYARPTNARYNRSAKKKQQHAKAADTSGAQQPKVVIMSSNAKPAGQGAAATKKATALGGLFTLGPKPAALEEEGEEEGEEDAEGAFRHQPPTNSTGGHAWIKQDIKGTMPAKMKKAMKVKNTIRFDDEGKAHTHQEPSSWADDEYGSDAPYGGKRRGGKRGGGKGRPSKYDDYGYDGYGYDGYDPYGKRGYYDDLDQDYYWDPKNNGQGSVLRKKEARNVYNFLTSSEQYYAGQTVAYGATPRGQAPVTFTYTNELRCGAFGANARVGSCFAVATFDPTTLNGQITITCTLHEDASNLCGMKYVAGMRIAAQGPLKVTNPLSDTPNLKADMIPITGIYMPNRRTTLLADVATLLSGVKGGALMFDTNVLGDDGKFTFYFWR